MRQIRDHGRYNAVHADSRRPHGDQAALDNAACGKRHHRDHVAEPRHAEQIHRDADCLTGDAGAHADEQEQGTLAAVCKCQNRLRGGDAGRERVGCGKHGGVKYLVDQEAVHDGSERHADQNGEQQVGSAHQHGNADRENHRVCGGVGRAGNGRLNEVLCMNVLKAAEYLAGDHAEYDGNQRADDRGVLVYAHAGHQLQTDDRAEAGCEHGDHNNHRVKCLYMVRRLQRAGFHLLTGLKGNHDRFFCGGSVFVLI